MIIGKPFASDLRQRKASLPIVIAAASDSSAGRELRVLLQGSEPLDEAAILRGVESLDATAAEPATVALARKELALAYAALDEAEIERDARDQLCELASFVVDRQF